MRLANFPPKYVDSLHTSNIYQDCVKYGKSRYSITGISLNTAYLNEERPISEKVVQHPHRYATIFPRQKMLLDYLHVAKTGQKDGEVKQVIVGNSIDYLTDGYKVKFR